MVYTITNSTVVIAYTIILSCAGSYLRSGQLLRLFHYVLYHFDDTISHELVIQVKRSILSIHATTAITPFLPKIPGLNQALIFIQTRLLPRVVLWCIGGSVVRRAHTAPVRLRWGYGER